MPEHGQKPASGTTALPLSPAAYGAVAGKLACHTHEVAVVTSSGHAPNAARRYASFLMGVARGFGLIAGIMSATATGFLISQVGTLPDFPAHVLFPVGGPQDGSDGSTGAPNQTLAGQGSQGRYSRILTVNGDQKGGDKL